MKGTGQEGLLLRSFCPGQSQGQQLVRWFQQCYRSPSAPLGTGMQPDLLPVMGLSAGHGSQAGIPASRKRKSRVRAGA